MNQLEKKLLNFDSSERSSQEIDDFFNAQIEMIGKISYKKGHKHVMGTNKHGVVKLIPYPQRLY